MRPDIRLEVREGSSVAMIAVHTKRALYAIDREFPENTIEPCCIMMINSDMVERVRKLAQDEGFVISDSFHLPQ